MASSILNRLALLFKSSAHQALDAVEDPGALARQMVRELSAEIARTEEAMVSVLGEHHVLSGKRDTAKAEAADWNDKAEKAVSAGRDDLATSALERAERAQRTYAAYAKAVVMLDPQVDGLKAKLAALRRKKEDADSTADVLAARASAAAANGRAARILGAVGDNQVDFERLRDSVSKLEATSEAMEEVASEKNGTRLEAELAALSVNPVAQRLAALKEQHAVKSTGGSL